MQRQIVSEIQPLQLDVYVAFFLLKSLKPSMFKGLNVLKIQRVGMEKSYWTAIASERNPRFAMPY